MNKCPHDPRQFTGAPMGQYHCPVCLVMVLAGCEHGDVVSECCHAEMNFATSDGKNYEVTCTACGNECNGDYPPCKCGEQACPECGGPQGQR